MSTTEHYLYGTYTRKAGKVTYHTHGTEHAHAAKQARDAKRDFKFSVLNPEQQEFVGKVERVRRPVQGD